MLTHTFLNSHNAFLNVIPAYFTHRLLYFQDRKTSKSPIKNIRSNIYIWVCWITRPRAHQHLSSSASFSLHFDKLSEGRTGKSFFLVRGSGAHFQIIIQSRLRETYGNYWVTKTNKPPTTTKETHTSFLSTIKFDQTKNSLV